MNLIGILNWYDEEPSWLSATVASMCRIGMSHIVAVDGAYLAYPGAITQPRSAPGQHAAIREVCDAMQVGHTIHAPAGPWVGGECEKRSYGFRLAETIAVPGEDWYFLMDADQVITTPGNLAALETAGEDVAEALFYERGAYGGGGLFPVRCIFRAEPGLHVTGRHYDYLTGDGRNLWGDAPYEPAASTQCEVEHRTRLRYAARKQAQDAYYKRRDELHLEQAPEVPV